MPTFISPIQQYSGNSSQGNRQEKEIKSITIRNKEAKLLSDDITYYVKSKGIYRTTTRGVSPGSSYLVSSLGQRLATDTCLVFTSPQNVDLIFISSPNHSLTRLLLSTHLVPVPECIAVSRALLHNVRSP